MDLGLKQAIGLLIVIFLAALILMLTGSLSANDGSKAKSNHGALWSGAENVLLNASESDNLVTNGNLRRGMYGWDEGVLVNDAPAGSKYKTSVAESHTNIFKIKHDKTYSISFDYKDRSDASKDLSTYPAYVIPFDADKKWMEYQMFYDGGPKSHLTQPLRKGDKVIHIDSLNSWNTSKNWYNLIAIYGYKNSKGETYSDYTYTRNIIQFHNGNTTDKTEINKTNGTITIPAWTGETIPAGTAVSQNHYGSTYIYPYYAKTDKAKGWQHVDTEISFNNSCKLNYIYLTNDNEKYIEYIKIGSGFATDSVSGSKESPLIHNLVVTEN